MTESLDELLSDLNSLLSFLTKRKDRSLVYESKLKEFSLQSVSSVEEISETALDRARQAWDTFRSNPHSSEITKKTLRVLCTISDIVCTNEFQEYLAPQSELSPRTIRALVTTYHTNWDVRESLKLLEQVLAKSILEYDGRNRMVSLWKGRADEILGARAPVNIAAKLSTSLAPLCDHLAEMGFGQTETRFGAAITVATGKTICQSLYATKGFPRDKWDYVISNVLGFKGLTKINREVVIANLIMAIEGHRSETEWKDAQDFLKDYVLKHPDFGDPRVKTVSWQTVDRQAKEIFLSWLSEEDLAFFFELIIKEDPHHRKPFWLRYVKSIKNSVVVVGENHRRENARVLSTLQTRGRRFARGVGLDTSAFIMDFGKYVVVEFSTRGNACYLYESSEFAKAFPSLTAPQIQLGQLKQKDLAIDTQSHFPKWPVVLREKLQELGIYADK